MHVHFLWWEGCPSHPDAWVRLQKVLAELQVDAEVERIEIKTDEDAERWHFPGSPTILINGKDLDPRAPAAYRLTCRLYWLESGRASPMPSEEMIRHALLQAMVDRRDS